MQNLKLVYLLVFSTLAAWAIFAYFTTTEIIMNQKEYADIINVTGKQRMYSQQTALLSKMLYEKPDERLQMRLHDIYLNMKKDHEHVMQYHLSSKSISSIYNDEPDQINVRVRHYFTLLLKFIDNHELSTLKHIERKSLELVPLLNKPVLSFKKESDEKAELLLERELFILVGTLLTLFLEAIFIVLPALNKANIRESELNVLIKKRTTELEKLSITDELTKLYNRRHINNVLSSELDKAKRYDDSFSIILLDIDHFKRVNDTYGHQVGDDVLKVISSLLTSNVRQSDLVGRWGGEEFLILTTENDFAKVRLFCEKLRSVIEAHKFRNADRITCSFGLTQFAKGDNSRSILARVDKALYQAKAAGRNCIKELRGP